MFVADLKLIHNFVADLVIMFVADLKLIHNFGGRSHA